jgi:hypothetical protein
MFSEIMTTLQGMNNTTLIVLFACAGVAYFKFVRPELQDARTLRTTQFAKIESLASREEFTRIMDTMTVLVATSVKENISIVTAADEKINKLAETVNIIQQDLLKHTEDTTAESDDRTIRIDDLINNTSGIEALIEHLILEMSKSGHIADTSTERLQELKNRVLATKLNINHMMELFNQQLITTRSRTSKLNRVVNTRI